MTENNQLQDVIEDLKLLLKQTEILGQDFDNFLKKLKSNSVKSYLLALRDHSQPEQALKDNFFASGSTFARHLFKNLSPEVGGESGFIDYLIKAEREEISLEVKPLFEAEFEKGKSGEIFKKIKKIRLSWEKHKDQIRKYLGRRGEFVVFTNLEEWYFFSRNYSLDEACNYFASTTLFELLDDFKQVDDFWQYLDKQEDLSVKEPLDKKFFSSLKSWVQELRKVKFSVDEKEKTKLIINLLNKFIFIQSLDKFWVIQSKYIENKWSNIEREWQAKNKLRILKKFLGEINEYFYELYDTELFKDGEGRNILDYIQDDEENIELLYKKLKLVLGIDYGATAIGWVRGVIQYNFRRIDEDILGKAYETFLAEVRREQGIYYTPKYITQYIVENTVGKQYDELLGKIKDNLQKKRFNESNELIEKFVSIKVLDPACGSGSFLIKALKVIWIKYEELNQLLDNYHKTHNNFKGTLKQSAEDKENTEKINELKKILDYKDKRDLISKIIIRHIHGNDLDGNALEVAKVNLWLEAIKLSPQDFQYDKLPNDTNHILPDLEINLGNGDSLVGLPEEKTIQFLKENFEKELREMSRLRRDYLKNPTKEEAIDELNKIKQGLKKEVDKKFKQYLEDNNLPEKILQKTKPFHWALDFWYVYFDDNAQPKQKEQQGFDVVIGNPPYIRIHLLKESIRKFFSEEFVAPYKDYDIYLLFIEKGSTILLDNGILGYITPSHFMERDYGKNLRSLLIKSGSFFEIIKFMETGVFEATNYPVVFSWKKGDKEKTMRYCEILAIPDTLEKLQEELNNRTSDVQQNNLSIKPWYFHTSEIGSIFNKINNNSEKLSSISRPCLGVQSGSDKILIGHINKNDTFVSFKPSGINEEFKVENRLLKKILKGKHVKRFLPINSEEYIFYPYEDNKLICESDLKQKYQNWYKFLSKFKKELENRKMYGKSAKELHGEWYALMYNGGNKIFDQKKILTPALTEHSNFTLDTEKVAYVMGTAGVWGIDSKDTNIFYLLGILNSKIIDFVLRKWAPVKRGGYRQYSKSHLDNLPIYKMKEEQKPIIELVEKIITLKKLQHKFREIWKIQSQGFGGRNSYRSLGEILQNDAKEIQEGNFDKVWVSEASIYPDGKNELLEKQFDDFRIRGEDNNVLKLYGIADTDEELILEIKVKNKEFRDIIYLEILELFDSRSRVKSLKDVFDKSIVSVIQPNIWENSGNLIKGAEKKFEEWLKKENFNAREKDIVKIDKEIQDVDNQIDAHVFKLYELDKEEVETVLDSLNLLDSVKNDILNKFEKVSD